MTLLDDVSNGDLNAVKAFVERKPRPDNFKAELICPTCRTSVLSKAAEKGHTEIIQYLIGRNNLPSAIFEPDVLGDGPLKLAQDHGHKEAARLLLWSKAGKTANKTGLTAQCRTHVKNFVEKKAKLRSFFPGDSLEEMLKPVVQRATEAAWSVGDLGVTEEEAVGLSILTIYDVVILIDDSGSMEFQEEGRRIPALKLGLKAITTIHASLSHEEDAAPSAPALKKSGIRRIQFMNKPIKGKALNKIVNIDDPNAVDALIDKHSFGGGTPIGTALKETILDPFVFRRKTEFVKPLLIMVITDGEIDSGEKDTIIGNIEKSVKALQDTHKVPQDAQAIIFQFVLIGEDEEAAKMLKQLSRHKTVGRYISCSTTDWVTEDIIYMADNNKRKLMLELMTSALEIKEQEDDDDDGDDDDDAGD
ncbi:hypothetical protein CC78DRAFT_612753 [Lojkania enalia]|uniref:VWFA domain-containing protein n=1 Tax=Lojkania enalia TaxID=147567 RepID=A0A9P4KIA5_9PLEO|nr:hypothetical protein CC78DRAFT_612753 [Didymosphaeria enalia]